MNRGRMHGQRWTMMRNEPGDVFYQDTAIVYKEASNKAICSFPNFDRLQYF